MHGGAAPQVRRAAQVRILEASDKAAARLVQLMQSKDVPYAVQLSAARDLLDRANVVGTQEVAVTVKPWEEKMQSAIKVRYKRASRDSGESGDATTEDIVDAEIVEDPDYEAALDAEMLANEAERRDRKRRGQPVSLPSEQSAPRQPTTRPQARATLHQPEADLSFVADPPTRRTDEQWHAEQLAKARAAGKGRLRPNPRIKRR
jgi:hypothetical protein